MLAYLGLLIDHIFIKGLKEYNIVVRYIKGQDNSFIIYIQMRTFCRNIILLQETNLNRKSY